MNKFDHIAEMKNFHEMTKADIKAFADCLAVSFDGYPLFRYFMPGKDDAENMKFFWKIDLTTILNRMFCVGNSATPDVLGLFAPPGYTDASFLRYVAAGGVGLNFKYSPGMVARSLGFQSFAGKIKKKYSGENCWYLYCLVTRPHLQGKGLCSRLLRPMLEYFDREKCDCYLETFDDDNIPLYEHYGFKICETVRVPKSDLVLRAMLRKPQNFNQGE